jgi:hypothetical protein
VWRDWGLGVAAQVLWGIVDNRALNGSNGGSLVGAPWHSISVGLLMSATTN